MRNSPIVCYIGPPVDLQTMLGQPLANLKKEDFNDIGRHLQGVEIVNHCAPNYPQEWPEQEDDGGSR